MKVGHGNQSQHYAGTAFDVGQRLSNSERNRLRTSAINSGIWAYVEPASLTPTWVHFDKRRGKWYMHKDMLVMCVESCRTCKK